MKLDYVIVKGLLIEIQHSEKESLFGAIPRPSRGHESIAGSHDVVIVAVMQDKQTTRAQALMDLFKGFEDLLLGFEVGDSIPHASDDVKSLRETS
jgi:hypothetical protein